MKKLLKSTFLNGWYLFGWIIVPMSIITIYAWSQIDTTEPVQVSSMIQLTVRLAIPWLYLAFATSSLVTLWPGLFTVWLMRNRKFTGLCFAAGMAWQLLFILWYVLAHFEHYVIEAYTIYAVAVGVTGYAFLIPMAVTSFKTIRRHMSNDHWKLLHLFGMYNLWIYAYSTYFWEMYYYDDKQLIDYVYFWVGLGVVILRFAAWAKRRKMADTAFTAT
jgi:sulfoxide reductase heme-binding subunit YedZ